MGGVNDFIVDQGKSGNTWYRVWHSGFKECGGIYWKGSQVKTTVTLNFPVTFSNTNYTFHSKWLYNSTSGQASEYGEIYTQRATTYAKIYDNAGWFGYEWRVEGY